MNIILYSSCTTQGVLSAWMDYACTGWRCVGLSNLFEVKHSIYVIWKVFATTYEYASSKFKNLLLITSTQTWRFVIKCFRNYLLLVSLNKYFIVKGLLYLQLCESYCCQQCLQAVISRTVLPHREWVCMPVCVHQYKDCLYSVLNSGILWLQLIEKFNISAVSTRLYNLLFSLNNNIETEILLTVLTQSDQDVSI